LYNKNDLFVKNSLYFVYDDLGICAKYVLYSNTVISLFTFIDHQSCSQILFISVTNNCTPERHFCL